MELMLIAAVVFCVLTVFLLCSNNLAYCYNNIKIFLDYLFFFKNRHRPPPFMLILAPARKSCSVDVQCNFPGSSSCQLFLWPDRLRWSSLLCAILIVFPVLFSGDYLAILCIIAIAFFLQLFFIPYIIFTCFRIPVLNNVWQIWPQTVRNQLQSIPSVDIKRTKSKFTKYLPKFNCFRKDPVYWASRGSYQEAFLRMAVCEIFQRRLPEEKDLPDWQTKAFVYWLILWVFPIVSGYLVLLVLLLAIISFDFIGYKENVLYCLMISGLLWNLYAIYFVWSESREVFEWLRPIKIMQEYAMGCLPPAISQFKFSPSIYDWFNEKLVQLSFVAINIIANIFFISIVNIAIRAYR